jgi:hypothetical protein
LTGSGPALAERVDAATRPRSRSWIAPETISDAEALPWSTSTITRPSVHLPAVGADSSRRSTTDAAARVDRASCLGHELVEHVDRLRQQAARVRAQVEQQRLHALRLAAAERLLQLLAGRLREADDAHVADAGRIMYE